MEILFTTLLVLHIAGGATGLISGTINIVAKKGDKKHKRWGKLFFYAMLTTGCSSLMLSLLHPNYFLFIVGVLTLYLTATGNRYLLFKKLLYTPSLLDWAYTLAMLLTSLAFIFFGVNRLLNADTFGSVFLVFGLLGIRFSKTDITNYTRKASIRNFWLIGHLQRMTGSYIAALTAFLVVNGTYVPELLPPFVVWLLPTAVLLPVLIIWTRKYGATPKPVLR